MINVTWDGAAQTIGIVDAYMYSSQNTVYILNAAKGLQNDNYEFPIFRWGLDLDTDPQYGCALTGKYNYGSNYDGNSLWPTDVIEAAYYQSQNSQNMSIVGDWQLDKWTSNADLSMPNAQFDATTRTITCSITVPMFYYADMITYVSDIENPDNDDYLAGIANAAKKDLGLSLTNYVFDAPSSK